MVFKKKFLSLLCLCLAALLMLSSCGSSETPKATDANGDPIATETDKEGNVVEVPKDPDDKTPSKRPELDFAGDPTMDGIDTGFARNFADMFTERDLAGAYDESKCAIIKCNGGEISASSNVVGVSGSKALISKEGVYIIRGTLNDGTIIIDADDTAKIQIVLDNANLTSSTHAAIYVKNANKVFITLAAGTNNTVKNGGKFEQTDDNNVDAPIFSKQDITFNGTGSLTVESPAGHGIVGKDDLVIAGGKYNVTASGHAIDANDSVRITQATVTVKAGKDAIRAENPEDSTRGYVIICDGTYNLSAGGDAISATSDVQIDAGKFEIAAGVGADLSAETAPSARGIKADGNLLVADGTIKIETPDDAINVNGSIILAKGSLEIKAGDDALNANNSIYAVKADVTIKESYECYEAAHVEIRGGKHTLNSKDDAINAAGGADGSGEVSATEGSLKITAGEIFVTADGGDGFDVKGVFEMSGGLVVISVSAKDGHAAFDYNVSGTISGGMFVAAGSSKLPSLPTSEGQGVLSINAGTQAAGTEITVTDADGKTVIYEKIALDFEVVVVSSPEIVKGQTYDVKIGNQSGSFEAK
ncbi:MAG: carbohydrate-binding domain-containing protein [Clostridia bacterium]|nr:carbohydrate-binding domain-containing protein [Clostridia bacterium]